MIELAPDIETQPSVTLSHWKIVKLIDKEGNISEHVCGNQYYDYGRISTAMVEKGDGFVLTASGRIYFLQGEERKAPTRAAAYVLNAFKRINDLEEIEE